MNPGTNSIPATPILGDGIGPEIVDSVLQTLDALGAPFDGERPVGGFSANIGEKAASATDFAKALVRRIEAGDAA